MVQNAGHNSRVCGRITGDVEADKALKSTTEDRIVNNIIVNKSADEARKEGQHRTLAIKEAQANVRKVGGTVTVTCTQGMYYGIISRVCVCVFYLLGKGGYVFGSVGLYVCLFVDNITQNVINGLGLNFMEGSWVAQ